MESRLSLCHGLLMLITAGHHVFNHEAEENYYNGNDEKEKEL